MKKKVLLMGKSGSGKTSIRSIIFANFIARDTRRLAPTLDVEHSTCRFLSNLQLRLWDCGGLFMQNFFTSQRDQIFCNVDVLIYVFDVESRDVKADLHYYQTCLEALLENSPEAKVFCLIHKLDLVAVDQRNIVFKERETDLLQISQPFDCTCFRTSIYDETLFKPWSCLLYKLLPNVEPLEHNLQQLATIVDADKVLLFDKATFLVIAHNQRKPHRNEQRFEKISIIIKQFQRSSRNVKDPNSQTSLYSCKLAVQLQSMEVRNSHFAAFFDQFTPNTYVMVIMSDANISSAAALINIRNAKKFFELKIELEQ